MTLARDIRVGMVIAGHPCLKVARIIWDGDYFSFVSRGDRRWRYFQPDEEVPTIGPQAGSYARVRADRVRLGDCITGFGTVAGVTMTSRDARFLFNSGETETWPRHINLHIQRGSRAAS